MNQNIYDDFADHLVCIWEKGFEHNYKVTHHPAWNRWRQVCTSQDKTQWYCSSLKQAADHYSWTGEEPSKIFSNLSMRLRDSINRGDAKDSALVCGEIFEWGGVARRQNDSSRLWVIAQRDSSQLCDRLLNAVDLLNSSNGSLDKFDGQYLLMNSAMTKIYAACDSRRLIIYDGRVGAALGLLVKDYLHSIGHQGVVPDHLAFRWGSSRRKLGSRLQNERNPSDGDLKFKPLFGTNLDQVHAEMMRKASFLINKAASSIGYGDVSMLHRLEKALFMIGYDVSRRIQ